MVPLLPWYLLQQHLRPLLTITLQLAISLTIPLELLLRPTLRLLRRSFPPNRQLYRLMRLGNQSRWRLSARADILEALYKAVMDFSKAVEAERGATESYDRTVVYLPALKVNSISKSSISTLLFSYPKNRSKFALILRNQRSWTKMKTMMTNPRHTLKPGLSCKKAISCTRTSARL